MKEANRLPSAERQGLWWKCCVFALACLGSSTAHSWARVFEEAGNIYLENAHDRLIQLTSSGTDSAPRLSRDGSKVVFVRRTPGLTFETPVGTAEATEIRFIDLRDKEDVLLLRGKQGEEEFMAQFTSPDFSEDGRFVFFTSAHAPTTGRVAKINLEDRSVNWVTYGSFFRVIPHGPDKGDLLVEKSRIEQGENGESRGRRYYLCVVSPDGDTIREIGEEGSAAVMEYMESHAADRPESASTE